MFGVPSKYVRDALCPESPKSPDAAEAKPKEVVSENLVEPGPSDALLRFGGY
jgi:hypothetical protein